MIPQSSQTPKRSGEDEADDREQVQPQDVRAVLREDPDQRRADEPAEDDERDRDPVRAAVDVP